MHYTVGPYWLSILHVIVCACQSQSPNLSLSKLPLGEGNDNPLHYSCLGNPMDRGASVQSLSPVRLFVTPWTVAMPGLPVHHQLLEPAQTYVH